MTEYYYIDEVQNRPDGVTNVAATVQKNTLASALSYYYERKSKLVASETFVSFGLGLRTNTGRQVEPWAVEECPAYTPAE